LPHSLARGAGIEKDVLGSLVKEYDKNPFPGMQAPSVESEQVRGTNSITALAPSVEAERTLPVETARRFRLDMLGYFLVDNSDQKPYALTNRKKAIYLLALMIPPSRRRRVQKKEIAVPLNKISRFRTKKADSWLRESSPEKVTAPSAAGLTKTLL
jgi:hypothetical protein